MNFALYPHDTQECKLQMESCEWNTNDIFSIHDILQWLDWIQSLDK